MNDSTLPGSPFHVFQPPYRRLEALPDAGKVLDHLDEWRGAALVWRMSAPLRGAEIERAQCRPPGISLVVILPRSDRIQRPERILRVVELCRPTNVLPHHDRPDPLDLRMVLSRPPDDLPSEVTDYLAWRGVSLDMETRMMVRRTVELSADLRTVQALARSLYLSRRALGRRFLTRGLPVPSHWLQMSRLLRAAIRLQNSDDRLLVVASSLGYPDGFALSNQMKRLTGLRPSDARRLLGWEWLLESWLRVEARSGSMSRDIATLFHPLPPARAPSEQDRRPRMETRSRREKAATG